MREAFNRLRRFLRELKRRSVYQVAVTYAVVGFVLIEAADLIFPALNIPSWAYSLVVVLVLFGFPIALVLAWAFDLTPEGVRRTPASGEPVERAGDPAGGEARPTEAPGSRSRRAIGALVGLGLVGAAVAGGWYLMGGGGESPEVSEGTVAVLPFEVSGSGADEWRDGMVSLLSTGLDGAGGLRAIPDRTVFAAWKQRNQQQAGASTEEALLVAREIGARYAVVGSAVALGSGLRLTADVREANAGDRLGQVEVRGSADSVMVLADSLTRRVLGVLLEKSGEEIPSVDLASLTTSSLPALKSYLRGEQHFRAGEYELAIEDYEAAIEQDSSFALAYPRLWLSLEWLEEGPEQRLQSLLRRAYELSSDRLPRRERRLVRALYIREVQNDPFAAADTLRRLTEDYPDDPSAWYELGELIYHGTVPGGWPEAEGMFEEAVRLDPGVAPYHHHLIGLAMSMHHDSALAARRIEAHPSGQMKNSYQALWDLSFGSGDRRQDAWSRIDTLPFGTGWWVNSSRWHPTDVQLGDTVLRRVMEREDVSPSATAEQMFRNGLQRGRTEQALADLKDRDVDEDDRACLLAYASTLGHAVPDSTAARHLAPEQLPDEPSLDRFHCAGLYLVESGRGDELESLVRRLQATVDTTGPDGVLPGQREVVVQEVRGYRAWKQGELERASELWDRSNQSEDVGAIWRGDLHRELGRLETAEGWYQAAWTLPVAHERLGQLYEEMGRPEDAAAAYRRFIAAWEDADPELQDRVEAARERLRELTSSEDTIGD